MRNRSLKILLAVSVILFSMLACEFSATSANIKEASMAFDSAGDQPATSFGPNDVLYAVVQLANAPDDTVVKAVWIAVDVEGVDPGYQIEETELETGSGNLYFELSNTSPWPSGSYRVDLYLNGEMDQSLEFTIQ